MNARIGATALIAAIFCLPLAATADTYYKPAGSTMTGTIQQEINTKTAQSGQRFTVVTAGGSTIYGHISQVDRANIGRKAHVKLNFDYIRFPDGSTAPIHATAEAVQQKKQVNYVQAAGQVLGGMVVGNVLGKAVGTNLGGLAGLAGGALLASNTSTNIDIPAGAQITLRLNEPLSNAHPQAR